MYWELLNYDDSAGKFDIKKIASTLRMCVSGGASLPIEVLKGFEEKYQVQILEGYGLKRLYSCATEPA